MDKLALLASPSATDDAVVPEAVSLDGVTDYMSRSTDLVGNVDSKTFTFSCWLYIGDTTSLPYMLALEDAGTNRGYIAVNAGTSALYFVLKNSANTAILNLNTVTACSNTFIHIAGSFDMSDTAKRHIYINDNPTSPTWTTYTNDVIDFTSPSWVIGASKLDGSGTEKQRLSNLFLAYEYIDLSIEANRRIFIDSDGKPA